MAVFFMAFLTSLPKLLETWERPLRLRGNCETIKLRVFRMLSGTGLLSVPEHGLPGCRAFATFQSGVVFCSTYLSTWRCFWARCLGSSKQTIEPRRDFYSTTFCFSLVAEWNFRIDLGGRGVSVKSWITPYEKSLFSWSPPCASSFFAGVSSSDFS